jgi:hypothetical protein
MFLIFFFRKWLQRKIKNERIISLMESEILYKEWIKKVPLEKNS